MNIVFNLVTAKLKGKIRLLNGPYQGCQLVIQLPCQQPVNLTSERHS
jgi:hypothetical protein